MENMQSRNCRHYYKKKKMEIYWLHTKKGEGRHYKICTGNKEHKKEEGQYKMKLRIQTPTKIKKLN